MLDRVHLKFASMTALLLLLVGCDNSKTEKKIVFDITAPNQHEIAGAGTIRRVFGGADAKTLIEKHTPYADGTKGHVYNREADGSVRIAKEEYKDGTTKSHANFAEDGKTLVNGEIRRPDGTLFLSTERRENGKYRTQFYTKDGKHAFVVREQISGNEVEDTYFRLDKTVWAKTHGVASSVNMTSDTWLDMYKEHESRREVRIEGVSGGQTFTHFNAGGQPEYKQLFGWGYDQTNQNNHLISGLDEFDSQGQVVRGLVFKEENSVITLVEARHRVQSASYPYTLIGINVKKYRSADPLAKVSLVDKWKDERQWIQPKERKDFTRSVHFGTLSEVVGPDGKTISKHEPTDKIVEAPVDLAKLRFPKFDAFEQARNEFWRADRAFLGHRDDTDPCRWYHK